MCGDYNDIWSLKLNTFTYKSDNETLKNDIFKKVANAHWETMPQVPQGIKWYSTLRQTGCQALAWGFADEAASVLQQEAWENQYCNNYLCSMKTLADISTVEIPFHATHQQLHFLRDDHFSSYCVGLQNTRIFSRKPARAPLLSSSKTVKQHIVREVPNQKERSLSATTMRNTLPAFTSTICMKVVLLLELAKNTEMVDWRAAMLCWRVALTELKNTYRWIYPSTCLSCVPTTPGSTTSLNIS